jgi:hypothetical protein
MAQVVATGGELDTEPWHHQLLAGDVYEAASVLNNLVLCEAGVSTPD